jgi:urea transport system permease protein
VFLEWASLRLPLLLVCGALDMNSKFLLPAKNPLMTRIGWSAWLVALVVLCAMVPVLNLAVPKGSVFHLSDFAVALVAKIMCYAICALAMDLIWGYTGILSLGHGLFLCAGWLCHGHVPDAPDRN